MAAADRQRQAFAGRDLGALAGAHVPDAGDCIPPIALVMLAIAMPARGRHGDLTQATKGTGRMSCDDHNTIDEQVIWDDDGEHAVASPIEHPFVVDALQAATTVAADFVGRAPSETMIAETLDAMSKHGDFIDARFNPEDRRFGVYRIWSPKEQGVKARYVGYVAHEPLSSERSASCATRPRSRPT
jgi:hypothetical protein